MEPRLACLDEDTVLALLDGRLSAPDLARAEAHLASCASCLELVALGTGAGAPPPVAPAVSPDQLSPGSTVGRYVILHLVGRGGMGEVYAAYDPELDRQIALKLLGARGAGPASGRARLLQEAKAIARLSHPNVVAVYDAGTIDDRVFIAMELVDGGTLAEWLKEKPRPWQEVRDVFVAAGHGLEAAHAAGLVHRDFKPQNVMVGHDGKVRVMDFGLASGLDDRGAAGPSPGGVVPLVVEGDLDRPRTVALTATGVLLGTPLYMAPEQFRAEPADPRTDQFSFCVALYEALYGERPFAAPSLAALIEGVTSGVVRDPPRRVSLPSWMRATIARGLRPDRTERFPSMRELLTALTRDPERRRRRMAAALALVAALGIGAVMVRREAMNTRLLCRGAAERLASAWEPATAAATPRRARVRAAFLATKRAYAARTWELVAAALDRYASAWAAMYTDSCEATHVRGEQSEEILDLRTTCLHDRSGELKALVDVFATADAQSVSNAISAVEAMTPLERCADVPRLKAVVPLPRDEAARRRVAELQRRFAEVKALSDAGRHQDGLAMSAGLLRDARDAGYKPLLSEILSVVAWLEEITGAPRRAEGTYEQSLLAAEASRYDEIAARSSAQLAGIIGYNLSRPDEGERWARLSEAILERMGKGNEVMTSWLLHSRAIIRERAGDLDAARAYMEEAIALLEKTGGSNRPEVGRSLITLGNLLAELGQPERALAVDDRALEIFKRLYGDQHPILGQVLSNRGEALDGLRRWGDARRSFERSIELWEPELGPEHRYMAYPLTGLGVSALGAGDPARALAPLERALRIREANETARAALCETRFALARALRETAGAEEPVRDRAQALATLARGDCATLPHLTRVVAEIDVWLAGFAAPTTHGRRGNGEASPKLDGVEARPGR